MKNKIASYTVTIYDDDSFTTDFNQEILDGEVIEKLTIATLQSLAEDAADLDVPKQAAEETMHAWVEECIRWAYAEEQGGMLS